MDLKSTTPEEDASVSSASPVLQSSSAAAMLSPAAYMESAINDIKNNHFDVHAIEAKSWEEAEIDRIEQYCKGNNISMVVAYSNTDVFHHILINERLGNVVPSKLALLYCLNKHLLRQLEARPFWFDAVDPINESDEEILAKIPKDEWPFLLKNTLLDCGRGMFKIQNEDDLRKALTAYRGNTKLQKDIEAMMNAIKKYIDPGDLPKIMPPLIAEHLIDLTKSIQYGCEGYITPEGSIIHYGLTEAVYFNNHHTIGFLSPSMTMQPAMAAKLEEWVNEYMGKLVKLGYINHFFNVEFFVMDECDTIYLTEINPRIGAIDHYSYLNSFGNNIMVDYLILAKGEKPGLDNPWKKWKTGEYFKYSFVMVITGQKKGMVSDILDYEYVTRLEEEEKIIIRHMKQSDYVITDEDMTAAGIWLMMIWITGDTMEQVIMKEHEVRKKVYKDAVEVEYPAHWSV